MSQQATIILMRKAKYTDQEIEEELGITLQDDETELAFEELYCTQGKHKWTRDKKRGKKPHNCPEHKPIQIVKSSTRTLHCELGDHNWEAPRKQGRVAKNCPEHRPTPVIDLDKMQNGRRAKNQTEREKKIQEIIEGKSCQCGIKPTMYDIELRALYPGCREDYICGVLDSVMRNVYTYV
jgi:8-oxo-dGTP pyrophosphatase MutT (NUDIX family)